MDANGGEAIGECGGGVSDVNEEMNAEEVGGDEVQEEHLPEGEPGFDLGADDILNQVWNSVEDAYEFYRRYGRVNGFGVRKGDSDKDSHGNVVRYRFFCNKEGLREIKHYNRIDRQRGHKAETRTGCKAMLSIYLEKSEQKWKVRKVVLDHNHDLAPVGMSYLIRSHHKMTDAAKAHIDGMHAYGIGTSKILGHMDGMSGGYSLLGFLKKDAYNYADKMRRSRIADGDANATLVYLEGKAAIDPMYVARYNLTKDERLGNMVWADGNSRSDFQCFGDVLAFDSTYRKNRYKRPVVIFSGSNNHKQTTIFGFGLLIDETVSSYTWMLQNLLEVMCQKKPCVVVTDGDKAMIKAVKSVLPEATHRLCAWHVEKNVTSNVKDERLRSLFKRWLYMDMEVNEFEEDWAAAIEEFGLQDSSWARHMHEKRKLWANAYLRDKFCAGFRTTSRCEGINAVVNKFSKSSHTILELVQNLELVVREYRNKEMLLQFNSIYTTPVMTTCLRSIEIAAASVYTREFFADVRKEIEGAGAVNLLTKKRCLNTTVYYLEEYEKPDVQVMAAFGRGTGKLNCQCFFWEKNGYPCRHMFFVMKAEHLREIPERLVL
ncbi:protein FAR1-RELATED SEQUENCE 5-like [Arachis hypogaea]|uniref:protein FAR1-RELATED SEQUENCE 5-like n=1 Tax=Arachis hypogaea TaxID=3818 RepID=UPI000DEC43C1|nr:protein FAR1-RELATED SEQUENCE 5-like [Arachis hypogaea]